jgi:hypothetical protein
VQGVLAVDEMLIPAAVLGCCNGECRSVVDIDLKARDANVHTPIGKVWVVGEESTGSQVVDDPHLQTAAPPGSVLDADASGDLPQPVRFRSDLYFSGLLALV